MSFYSLEISFDPELIAILGTSSLLVSQASIARAGI